MAVVVHPEFEYVKVYDNNHKTHLIIAKCRLEDFYPPKTSKGAYEIKETMKGKDLEGLEYVPLFEYM